MGFLELVEEVFGHDVREHARVAHQAPPELTGEVGVGLLAPQRDEARLDVAPGMSILRDLDLVRHLLAPRPERVEPGVFVGAGDVLETPARLGELREEAHGHVRGQAQEAGARDASTQPVDSPLNQHRRLMHREQRRVIERRPVVARPAVQCVEVLVTNARDAFAIAEPQLLELAQVTPRAPSEKEVEPEVERAVASEPEQERHRARDRVA